jgi:N-acetylmuramoyl-L-alanine amidase
MKIADHLLRGSNVSFKQTPNYYPPPFRTTAGLPDAIVIHYTAMTSYDDAIKVLTTRNAKGGNASAHLVIGKEGQVKQLAPFDHRTWHAGKSSYGGRSGYNSLAVGIEIDNTGWLLRYPDGTYSRPLLLARGYTLSEDEVIQARHFNPKVIYQYWHQYTDAQIVAVHEICLLLAEAYDIKEILGHDQISPERKQDPGPAFPIEELRNKIFSDRSDAPQAVVGNLTTGWVAANLLNIRSGAGQAYGKVALPLPYNTAVEIMDEHNGWYRVRTQLEGWVSKDYISPEALS